MSRRKRSHSIRNRKQAGSGRQRNKSVFKPLLDWLMPEKGLFTNDTFHGNSNWKPEQLVQQALIWAWQDTTNVTDAFEMAQEVCEELNITHAAHTYTGFINVLDRYRDTLNLRLRQQFHARAEEAAGPCWRNGKWLLMAFDGSRVTTPRTVSNEREFCAPDYGQGKTAQYRKNNIARRRPKACGGATMNRIRRSRRCRRPGSP